MEALPASFMLRVLSVGKGCRWQERLEAFSCEAKAKRFAELIAADRYRLMFALSYLESNIVIGSQFGSAGRKQLDAVSR